MAKKNVTNDSMILNLKKQIEEKKKLVTTSSRFSPVTNCMLRLNNENYNLNVIDKDTILYLIAKLSSLKTSLKQEMPDEKLIINSFDVDLWLTDLKNKFNILNKKLEEERLKKLESKLHNLLSTDKKIELEINEIMDQI